MDLIPTNELEPAAAVVPHGKGTAAGTGKSTESVYDRIRREQAEKKARPSVAEQIAKGNKSVAERLRGR